MDDAVKTVLEGHPNLRIKENEDGKCWVVCDITSHEMPCTLKAIETYINGKKYKNACEHQLTPKEKELCSQYLTERRRGQLYCKLTKRYLNNLPNHIRQHLNGRRFKKAVKDVKKGGLMQDNTKHQEVHFTDLEDPGTEMWVPPDSDSESAEIEGLSPEFEEDKSDLKECNPDDTYSFSVLQFEDTSLEENGTERPRKKLKRSAKQLQEKSKGKDKKKKKAKDRNRK
ncbi:surfeit locus protein 2-like [Dendronephthya gigantea]|uniref:surfeit locus protein 2-like n=1 Tax=Dendronephthya gigantea TaxID=151771 RepID=UPI0010694B40|nr:surfeit locus protein 2-like [Dendronephthya gigantea]